MQYLSKSGDWKMLDQGELRARMSENRDGRRREVGERRRNTLEARRWSAARAKSAAAEREHVRQVRRIMRDLGLLTPEKAFGPRIRIRNPKVIKKQRGPATRITPNSVLPKQPKVGTRARKAILDLKGREAVFLKISYLGLKTPNWRPGHASAHANYVFEADVQAGRILLSNMGETLDEIVAAWDAIEQIEQQYRANAKIQMRLILHMPTELNAEEQRAALEAICNREFGRLGLPYSASLHDGDEHNRNPHAHIDFSTRPFEREGTADWTFAAEKINGLADKAGLKSLRARICGHLNFALHRAGSDRRFTHQTYVERGIHGARRQEHLGNKRNAAQHKGEFVHMNERNAARAKSNWAAYQVYLDKAKLEATALDVACAALELSHAKLTRQVKKISEALDVAATFAHVLSPIDVGKTESHVVALQHAMIQNEVISQSEQLQDLTLVRGRIAHVTTAIDDAFKIETIPIAHPKETLRLADQASRLAAANQEHLSLNGMNIRNYESSAVSMAAVHEIVSDVTAVAALEPALDRLGYKIDSIKKDVQQQLQRLEAKSANQHAAGHKIPEARNSIANAARTTDLEPNRRDPAIEAVSPPPPVSGQHPPSKSPDPLKQIWIRDRLKANSAFPDFERISGLHKDAQVEAPTPRQGSASLPTPAMPAPLDKPSMADTGDGIPALPPAAQSITPDKAIATGPSNVGPSNNEFKDAVMEALRSPELLKGDALQTAIASMDTWRKNDRQAAEGLLKDQFENLAFNQTVMQWRLLRRKQRKSAEENTQHRYLTAQIIANDALIALIRSQAPAIELLLRKDARNLSLRDEKGYLTSNATETSSLSARAERTANVIEERLKVASQSKSPHITAWVKALVSGKEAQRLAAAQRIRNDDQAEIEAANLDPATYKSILGDAPNRHVKTQHVGPLRGQMIQIDRGLGIEPD